MHMSSLSVKQKSRDGCKHLTEAAEIRFYRLDPFGCGCGLVTR